MKRNFLLMLLLTLLPLAGWAQNEPEPQPGEPLVALTPVTVSVSPAEATVSDVTAFPAVTVAPEDGEPLTKGTDYTIMWYIGDEPIDDYETYSADQFEAGTTYTVVATLINDAYEWANDDANQATFTVTASTSAEPEFLVVNPQTTCVMTWGLPFELGVNDIIVTPNVSNDVKEEILEIIKINQDLSSQDQSIGSREFTIGLIDPEVRTVTVGGTTYTIQATGKGEINIQKGTNELVEGWENSVTLAQNLVFNGLKQNLVLAADYTFTSWSAEEGGNGYGEGQVAVIGEVKEPTLDSDDGVITYTGIKVLTNIPANDLVVNAQDFIGKTFYVIGTASNLPTGRLQLYAYEKVNDEDKLVAQQIWVEVKNTQLTTYAGAYEFFSISKADYNQAYKDAAIAAYAKEADKTVDQLTDDEKAEAVFGLQIPEPETYVFGTENPVLTETWVKEGELPTGINAGEYYVWVRATEGGDKYSADETVEFVGKPEIAKADPVLTGAFAVTNPCYIWTDEHAVHGLKAFSINITTPLKVNVKEGELLIPQSAEELNAGDIEYFVKVGTKNEETGEITYAWLNDGRQNAKLTEDVQFEVGYYQLVARSKARANYNRLDPKNSDVTFDFVVVKPSVAIQTLVKGEASANYGFGVKPQADDYDWEVAEWTGYEGPDIKKANIAVSYKWYNANDEEVDPTEVDLPVGIYTVVAVADFGAAAGTDFDYVVEPATVYIGETNILAAVEDQKLVFGQELPLKLKYSQGAFTPNTESGAAQIKKFENTMWASGFKATNTETGEEIKLYAVKAYDVTTGNWFNPVTNTYYRTTILPVGTYTVSADVAYADNKNYKIAAAAGTWTVTAKDINNEDFGNWQDPHDADDTPEPRVKGMGGTFKLSKTYTSEEITLYEIDEDGELVNNDLKGKFTYRQGFVRPIEVSDQDQEPTPEQIEELNKQIGFYYGSLVPGEDFEITSYTNNINAGTATFHVKGIGNFTGEKDLTFTIDKAKIYVFPEIKKNDEGLVNVWAVGSPQEDAFQVDWESKTTVPVTVKQEATSAEVALIPRGIKHQLHAFKNDRPLVNPEIVNSNGFKDLKVQFIQGATVGEYAEGLQAYLPEDAEEADNYEFVFQTAPLTIVQGTIVLAVENIDANHNKAVTYKGTDRPRAKDAAGTFTLAPADKQVQELDPALQQQWWKVMSDKKENGDPWTITWEDNLDDLKQEIAGSNPKAYRYPASDALPEGQSYKIKCKGFEDGVTFSSTNYKFILAEGADEGTLTVNPADVTITVDNGETGSEDWTVVKKNYKDFIDAAAAWNADPKNASNQKTAEDMQTEWIATIGQQTDANGNITGNKYVKFIPDLQPGDVFTDLVASVTVNDDNEIIITAVDNKNYNIDEEEGIVDGTLVITPVAGTFALVSEPIRYHMDGYGDFTNEDGYDLPEGSEPIIKNPWGCVAPNVPADVLAIKANNKVPYETVKLKLKAASLDPENEAYSQWKAGEWHTMVLPFATTVADVCYNFKYAIVNVVDPEATEASAKPNDVHFKLQEIMDPIPANTPFCIKSQFDFDYNTTLVFGKGGLDATGEPIVIEYKDEEDVWSDAGKGFKFRGNYDVMLFTKDSPNVRFLGPNSRWKKITSDAKYTMQPYTGYVDLGSLKETREINFIFEEEDGSTTSINAAEMYGNKSAEGLYRIDGIKLQGAPTQKGVYIQDGKKFVK